MLEVQIIDRTHGFIIMANSQLAKNNYEFSISMTFCYFVTYESVLM